MLPPVSGVTQSSPPTTVLPPTQTQSATSAPQVAKKDQVDISKQAQQLASDGDTQAQEIKESGAEKASETANNKA